MVTGRAKPHYRIRALRGWQCRSSVMGKTFPDGQGPALPIRDGYLE